MTDETRKALTIYIGECWHEPKFASQPQMWVGGRGTHCLPCKHCGQNYGFNFTPRTFTAPDDMAAVRKAIIERGEWEAFEHYAGRIHNKLYRGELMGALAAYTQWLTDAETFLKVAGEAIEERVIGRGDG